MKPDFLVDFPGLGINDLPVSRVAFSIFGMPVYWYGLLIALAIILCMLLAMRQAPSYKLTSDDVMDTFIALIPLMIIFARLYYVVFSWDTYSTDWKLIFNTRHGGLAFYGGVIGGALGIILVTRLKKMPISRLLDFLAVYVPLGQAIGRWGNFFNQEAFGNNTSLPWGMYSETATGSSVGTNEYLTYLLKNDYTLKLSPTSPVHPTFLYEFIANIIIFFVLLRIRKNSKTPFAVSLWYLLLYGVVRFFVEGIRTDPLLIGNTSIRISQVLSAVMVIASALLLIVLNNRRQRRELAEALAGSSSSFTARTPEGSEGFDEEQSFVEIKDDDSFIAEEPETPPEEKAEEKQEDQQ